MNAQFIPLILWILGSTLLIAGAARFGSHTAAIVAGVLFIKTAYAIRAHLSQGFTK